MLRPRGNEDGTVLVADKRLDEALKADGKRKRLVRLRTTEGHEILGSGDTAQNVTVRHLAHRDVDHDGLAAVTRQTDREGIRADERLAAGRMRQPRR